MLRYWRDEPATHDLARMFLDYKSGNRKKTAKPTQTEEIFMAGVGRQPARPFTKLPPGVQNWLKSPKNTGIPPTVN